MNSNVSTPAERGLLQFYLARGLSYGSRLRWVTGLLTLGVLFGLLGAGPVAFAGVLFFFAASLLLTAAGYTNRPKTVAGGFWKTTDPGRLQQIVELNRRSRRWDMAALDVSNPLGVVCFLLALVAVGAAGVLGRVAMPSEGFALVVACGLALLLPVWFSGWRAGHTRATLGEKVKVLQSVLEEFDQRKTSAETVQASLRLQGTDDRAAPTDARLQIAWPGASADFLGVQCQVKINEVQGNKYPYCYFVAVARPGLGIFPAAEGLAVPGRITVETQRQGDVDVIVIRGHTTKRSGYHTKPALCLELLERALEAGRRIAGRNPTESD